MTELIVALRSEADLSEKGLDFMDDADLADETRVQIGMLRDAADTIEWLSKAFNDTTWDLAVHTFRGKAVSLGEEAETLRSYYRSRAAQSLAPHLVTGGPE